MELLRDFFLPEMVFLRYALLIGALSSIALGVIGTMVVTRRISSIAGASAHAALGGVGVALFLQRVCLWGWCSATLGAVVGAVASALLVGVVSICAREREDTIINVVWALGMAIGLLFLDGLCGLAGVSVREHSAVVAARSVYDAGAGCGGVDSDAVFLQQPSGDVV